MDSFEKFTEKSPKKHGRKFQKTKPFNLIEAESCDTPMPDTCHIISGAGHVLDNDGVH